jgi:hypothetical protein
MTDELGQKIHRQPGRAPVVAPALDRRPRPSIGGPVLAYPDDAERLERGAAVFEGLYAYISSRARSRPAE